MTARSCQRADIRILPAEEAAVLFPRLAEILKNCVDGGALVSFVWPFSTEQALKFWAGQIDAYRSGETLLFGAFLNGALAGIVHLDLAQQPNARHRAEISKLLVHGDFRNLGIGKALLYAAEDEASRLQRTRLLLDCVEASAAERLYRRCGWTEFGRVPDHFVHPDGTMRTSIYFMKHLA